MSDPLDSAQLNTIKMRMIRASLSGSLIISVLFGIYTVVYGSTMYLYVSQKKHDRRVAVTAITVLYMINLIEFGMQWYVLTQWMVINGATRTTTFLATLEQNPASLFIFSNDIFYMSFAVSDALLIWRCYHVWGRSLRIIAVPSAIFMAGSGLLVASFILLFSSNVNLEHQYNNIVSAFMITSAATTVVTTFLIGYRIHISIGSINGSRSRHRYNHVMIMIAESAAIYALALVVLAVTTVVPSINNLESPGVVAPYYITPVAQIVAGLAPTILVARIAIKGDNRNQIFTPTPACISDLEMGSASISGEKNTGDSNAIVTEPRGPPPGGNESTLHTS